MIRKKKLFSTSLAFCLTTFTFSASSGNDVNDTKPDFASRWHIWGYGEVSALRNFDRLGNRRSNPAEDFSALDMHMPDAGLWIEFDCGDGWTAGTEMHLDNAGAVPMKGPGTVASRNVTWDLCYELSEFWIQKSFSDKANLKVGWISTPVGSTSDLPTDFFGVTRPEDGPAFLALDCSAVAIDFNGEAGDWAYDIMAVPGLTGYDFGNSAWRNGDATFTQSMSRLYAGAFCVTNSGIKGLDLSFSGQFGGGYTMVDIDEETSRKVSNGLSLAAFNFKYDDHNVVARGAYQYGYLSNHCDAGVDLTECRYDMQGMSAGVEAGYDMFSLNSRLAGEQKLYVFTRYDWNRHKVHTESAMGSKCNTGHRVSFGIDWVPISSIVMKGECGFGFGSDPTRCFVGLSVGWCPNFN